MKILDNPAMFDHPDVYMFQNKDGSVYSAKALFADIRPYKAEHRHTYLKSLCFNDLFWKGFSTPLLHTTYVNDYRLSDKSNLV